LFGTNHAISCSLTLPPPSQSPTPPSALYFRKTLSLRSVLMCHTEFHNHIKQQAMLNKLTLDRVGLIQCRRYIFTNVYRIFFDVLLTVHLSIFISVINQPDAQNFCFTISLFHASTCFEHMCSTSGGQNCIIQHLVSSHLYGQVAFSVDSTINVK